MLLLSLEGYGPHRQRGRLARGCAVTVPSRVMNHAEFSRDSQRDVRARMCSWLAEVCRMSESFGARLRQRREATGHCSRHDRGADQDQAVAAGSAGAGRRVALAGGDLSPRLHSRLRARHRPQPRRRRPRVPGGSPRSDRSGRGNGGDRVGRRWRAGECGARRPGFVIWSARRLDRCPGFAESCGRGSCGCRAHSGRTSRRPHRSEPAELHGRARRVGRTLPEPDVDRTPSRRRSETTNECPAQPTCGSK